MSQSTLSGGVVRFGLLRRKAADPFSVVSLLIALAVAAVTIGAVVTVVWHLFVVRTRQRAAMQEYLAAQEISTQVHYPVPPHLTGAYRDAGWKRGDFPLAERLAEEVLSLPIGPHHTDAQIDHVCASLKKFFKCV